MQIWYVSFPVPFRIAAHIQPELAAILKPAPNRRQSAAFFLAPKGSGARVPATCQSRNPGWRSVSTAFVGEIELSVTAGGGSGEVQEGRDWIRPECLVNWIRKEQEKNSINHCGLWSSNTPGRIRTCDLRFRKPLLYPLSYRRSLHVHDGTLELTLNGRPFTLRLPEGEGTFASTPPPLPRTARVLTATSVSPSSRLMIRTPWVLRPMTLMSLTGIRWILPWAVIIITSSRSRTRTTPITGPLRSRGLDVAQPLAAAALGAVAALRGVVLAVFGSSSPSASSGRLVRCAAGLGFRLGRLVLVAAGLVGRRAFRRPRREFGPKGVRLP